MVLWELMVLPGREVKFEASNLIIRHEPPKNSFATTMIHGDVEFSLEKIGVRRGQSRGFAAAATALPNR